MGVIGVLDAVPTVTLVAHPHGYVLLVYAGSCHGLRKDEFFVFVFTLIFLRRYKVGVHGFVSQVKKVRPVLFLLPQPVQGVIGQDVGDIAALGSVLTVDVQAGACWKVTALAAEAHPTVEAWLGVGGSGAHAPLAKEPSGRTRLLPALR